MQQRFSCIRDWLRSVLIPAAPEFCLLAGITLVAAVLRFYKMGEWSFWGDEIFSVGFEEDGFSYSVWTQSLARSLIHFSTAYFGLSEWSARLVPALVGIVTIPVLYFPVRRLFGTRPAQISAVLLALSPWHLYWSQNARFYSLLLLFYTLALLAFQIGLEKDRPWYFILSLLFLGLAARERLIALFLVPTLCAYLILLAILPLRRPPGLNRRNLVLFFAPLLMIGVYFSGPFLKNPGQWLAGFGVVSNSPVWILGGVAYYVSIPIIVIAGFGAIYLAIQKNRAALLFGLGAIVPLLAMMLISLFGYSANRYVFVSLTSWILLASLAVSEFFVQMKGNTKILVIGVLSMLVVSLLAEDYLYFTYQNGNRPNWKAAFEFVRQHAEVGDRVGSVDADLAEYYLQQTTFRLDDEAISTFAKGNRVWLVNDMDLEDTYPELTHWIEANAKQVADFDVSVYARNFKMRVFLYTP